MAEQIVTSSVLILAICLIRIAFAKRMSPTILYALWLLVAVKLLVPMAGMENRFNVMNLISGQEQTQAIITVSPVGGRDTLAGEREAAQNGGTPVGNTETPSTAKEGTDVGTGTGSENRIEIAESRTTLRQILPRLGVWVAWIGSGVLAVFFIGSNLIFTRKLRKARVPVGEYRGLTVYEVSGQSSPYLYGLCRPAIYLSSGLVLAEEKREYILLHEYTHFRHKDYLWACVRSVCVILYWYHPLVWLAAVLSARDSELACDEGVVRALNEKRRMEYGETLLETLRQIRDNGLMKNPLGLSTGMTGGAKEMKTRMERISHQPHFGIAAMAILAVMSVGLVGCTYGSAAQGDSAEEVAGSSADKMSGEEALQLYAEVLENRSEETAFALLEMDTAYRVLIVSDGIYDEGTEQQASPYGTVYYYIDGECKNLGEVAAGGTAYPLRFSENGIYAGDGQGMTKYVIDEANGTLTTQKIWTVTYTESGEDIYTVETDGTTETMTEEEWYASYEEEQATSQIIHFAYEDEDAENEINAATIGFRESEYLRENPGKVGDFDLVGEDEITLRLDFNHDNEMDLITMKKGNANGKSENGEWDYYRLECNGSTLGAFGSGVIGGLWAFSPDGENILIGVIENGWYTTPATALFSYPSAYGDANIRYRGTLSQDIRSGESIASGLTVENGIFYIWDEWNHLYQDYVWKGYELGEDGIWEAAYQDSYELMGYPYLDSEQIGPTLLADVTLYDSPEGERIGTAAAGQEVLFHAITGDTVGGVAAGSDSMWYCLYGTDGELGWIESHWDHEKTGVVWGGTGLGEAEVFDPDTYDTWAG